MTIFKTLSAEDRVSTKTLLHEAIPITGTIVSGTYGTFPNDTNVKNFTHGMFQSVYDYPYLSSSANHIFDVSIGIHSNSGLYSSVTTAAQKTKKNNIYNQMAQVLMGYDKDGNVLEFDEDGDLVAGGNKINDAIFISFSRLLVKDEIKKGSFEMSVGVDPVFASAFDDIATIKDYGADNSYRVNSPAGEFGILYLSNSVGTQVGGGGGATDRPCGLLYYQAGVAVLTSSVFTSLLGSDSNMNSGGEDFDALLTGSVISSSADALRHRIYNIQFNNTIELNSTVYFCRAKHNEFNYSSNPTYLNNSQIRVKNQATDIPISYITSIGLYSADNTLLAVGKFSEPIRKDSNIELTFRARLDY
jgi:hypothetical protein